MMEDAHMTNEEYIAAILKLLQMIHNNTMLKRIYNFINNKFVGRGD